MFHLTVNKRFRARHALRHYRGGEEPSHEHDWLCSVIIEATELDAAGCAVDFAAVDVILDDAIAPFAGRAFEEIAPFREISPSAENIARHLAETMRHAIETLGAKLTSVTVWEDEDHGASYGPPPL